MKITGYFHLFPGEHNAGSETTVHAALRAMVRRGHEVQVICDRSVTAPYNIDGIEVVRPPRRGAQSWLEDFVKDCDLLITHLDLTSQAMGLATNANKPLVHFIHNPVQLSYWHIKEKAFGGGGWAPSCRLVVFNSHWIAEKENWPGPYIVVHPVVESEYYRCQTGDAITLVNPTPGKGVETFKALAKQMPDRHFLAVEGGYGEQIIKQSYENIEWMAHTPDARNFFRKTKVLLMPSEAESYGRVGIEAACAGIPTIAHPTEGLKEAFGDSGIFLDRNNVPAWQAEIERLLTDEIYYRKRSDLVLKLADSLDPEPEFDRLENALLVTSAQWKQREGGMQDKMWINDRRLYKSQDGQRIKENMEDGDSLYAIPGQQIPEDVAIQLGLYSPPAIAAVTVMPIPTDPDIEWAKTLHEETLAAEAKAVESPEENKAIEAPQENKAIEAPEAIKKRGRPKKAKAA